MALTAKIIVPTFKNPPKKHLSTPAACDELKSLKNCREAHSQGAVVICKAHIFLPIFCELSSQKDLFPNSVHLTVLWQQNKWWPTGQTMA